MPIDTVTRWLEQVVRTASDYDHAAHMNLISKRVRLTGIPGFEALGYSDWFAQCEHEFGEKIVSRIRYGEPVIAAQNDYQVMFRVFETVEASDGKVNAQGVEILIEREEDGQWRLLQERVLSQGETEFYKLAP